MEKCCWIFLLCSFVLMNTMCTSKANMQEKLGERIDSLLNLNYSEDAPGCAIAILKDGEILYQGYRGIANVNTKDKIDLNTVFNIASITKQFTVVGVLKLQELGLLSIEDSVAKFFPEFKSEIWEKVKLKHLMSQCSGVPDNRPRVDKDFMLYIVDKQCLEYMVDLDELKFEPGTNYDYKNPTFQILAEVVTRVSGIPFEEFQKKHLFEVAGMTNIRYFEPNIEIPSMAHGYICVSNNVVSDIDSDSEKSRDNIQSQYVDKNNRAWMQYDYGEETFFGTKADGGIYTSINDFICWENALMNNLILKAETLKEAYNKHITVTGSIYSSYQNRAHTSYGYGWFIDDTPGRDIKIYHTGDNGGFQAYAAKYLSDSINVIMFENRNDLNRWETQMNIETILIECGYLH